jgi:hypothetical protein
LYTSYHVLFTDLLLLLPAIVAATDARHGGPIAAANLIGSGERYGYAFHLAAYNLMCSDVQQLHIDIMCKWGPWSDRAVAALQQTQLPAGTPEQQTRMRELRALMCDRSSWANVRKALSHAHGTLHSQACQLLWQPGWTSGCAKTLGEEGEQLFSYLSRFSGTTRNQSSAGGQSTMCSAARSLPSCCLLGMLNTFVLARRLHRCAYGGSSALWSTEEREASTAAGAALQEVL